VVDPSGHDGLAELLTGLGIGESVDENADTNDIATGNRARSTVERFQDLEFSAMGETLWAERLTESGFTVLPLQQFSVGGHGPDLIAWGTPASTGVFTLLLGEVKATTSGRSLSLLQDALVSGAAQLSLSWVRKYQQDIIN
jgi:hypothetical protein